MTLGVFGYYNGKNAPIINEVIGHSESALSKDSIGLYAVQCMYEFYTASAWDSSIAMAIINQGGVRQNIPAGDITYGQVYASLPFDNDNVICSCDGATYKNYVTKTGCYRYPTNVDTSKIVDTQIYHLVLISYVSEKDSSLTEITRDADNRLRDILAADFRRNYNA
jgi:2',3'-cyclic-nucleotide 2'-phosphodiesterase (5'-nucleotidase family)